MSAREVFLSLKKQMDDMSLQAKVLEKNHFNLGKETAKAFRAYIIEEKLLSQKPWSLQIDYGGSGYLKCDVDSSEWDELAKFAQTDYHCQFELSDNESLRFDDGEITIRLKDIAHLQYLISTYGLNVRLNASAEKNIAKMESALTELKKWAAILND